MRYPLKLFIKTLFFTLAVFVSMVLAANVVIENITVTDTQEFMSPEDLILRNVVLEPTADVTAIGIYDIYLGPGTRVKAGARLLVKTPDGDSMHDRCEMLYFHDLDANPNDDDDHDGLTNYEECLLSTGCWDNSNNCPYHVDPTVASDDHDGDGLPDVWEIQYAGLNLNTLDGRNQDADGDGVSNWVEYRLGTNPLANDLPGPGLFYEYDKLGRIKKIQRIPMQ